MLISFLVGIICLFQIVIEIAHAKCKFIDGQTVRIIKAPRSRYDNATARINNINNQRINMSYCNVEILTNTNINFLVHEKRLKKLSTLFIEPYNIKEFIDNMPKYETFIKNNPKDIFAFDNSPNVINSLSKFVSLHNIFGYQNLEHILSAH